MDEQYNLKKFVDFGSRTGNYFISFNKTGYTISSGLYLQERIKNFSRVVLYFDSEKKSVGIEFTNDDNAEGAFKLIHGNKGTTGGIFARSFNLANKLNNSKYYGRKIPKKINYQGKEIFVIDLLEKRGEDELTTKK